MAISSVNKGLNIFKEWYTYTTINKLNKCYNYKQFKDTNSAMISFYLQKTISSCVMYNFIIHMMCLFRIAHRKFKP